MVGGENVVLIAGHGWWAECVNKPDGLRKNTYRNISLNVGKNIYLR